MLKELTKSPISSNSDFYTSNSQSCLFKSKIMGYFSEEKTVHSIQVLNIGAFEFEKKSSQY